MVAMHTDEISGKPQLIDKYGRQVTYVRLSVTDRCDFRCVYCMAEEMTFLPRSEILSLEEMELVARAFVELGVSKIRLTGGEPLVRHNILSLVKNIGQLDGLDELTLTTNASQLETMAAPLREGGIKRINISLDSLKPDRFRQITRTGNLEQVIRGIDSAIDAGFEQIKLNAVILKHRNDDEILDLVEFVRQRRIDISFIEEMPLGLIDEHSRPLSFISSDVIFDIINQQHTLTAIDTKTGGPSNYFTMSDSKSKIGFISPHSHNFCHLCNRVRVTVEGRLLLCLGNEHSVDLKAVLRQHPNQIEPIQEAIIAALDIKPERHHFELNDEPQILRFMNMTGG